ncbi:hypothetical protein [Flavobacterium tructae]|uniref:Peptidase S74 domain-containing protein n=1 Tax=Flavobacterium tructae TaxID=1114873 RepID=A0A1S1JBS4_9FLAO|nr:hypothetical protein [Flavobacterium tructae]OHT47024.1 hypothetical protein BHE19_22060 [Flavobacterium tructae]OXB14491.1 hypothetical protein B0A71_21565 [Flavobacterium tructae]
MKKISLIVLFGMSYLVSNAQSLTPTSHISAPGTADAFKAGYTFSYATAGTPWNGSLISYGGFSVNNYDTQISSDYGPNGGNHISFRTKNGDSNIWNPWIELATKARNDFDGDQSVNGLVGIGITPVHKLHINGGHGDSRILLHSVGGVDDARQADLMLWASEPGWTYSGVGIGNNVHNFKNAVGGLSLLNTARGGSYIRLLDNSMLFNVISSSGLDKQALSISSEGNIGIGVTNPVNKLDVNGRIHSKEVKIDLDFPAPDYVFSNDYKLRSLEEVEDYVKKNNHLPEIPSAKEFEKNGVLLAEMNMALLKKVEELILYMIEMKKDITILKEENKALKEKK